MLNGKSKAAVPPVKCIEFEVVKVNSYEIELEEMMFTSL